MKRIPLHLVALSALALTPAGPVAAQNLDLAEVGAALALPIITGSTARHDPGTITSIVITNTSSEGVKLGVQVISGDRDDQWDSNSFSCYLTGNETTEFVFEPSGRGSTVSFECSRPGATGDNRPGDLNIRRSEGVAAQVGIMFVYVTTLSGETSSDDVLVGESSVIDLVNGSAFEVGAIPFQGGDPLAQDGDLRFRFDGLEYAQFPSVLTSNFHAPTGSAGRGTDAFLILFTLDGTASSTPPRARVKIDYYNDDERHRNAAWEFECFTIVSLEALAGGFNAASLGSSTGHIRLTPQPTNYPNRAHDAVFGGSPDGVRRAPVHGWLITRVFSPGGRSERAKTLGQSGFSLTPTGNDVPGFNAQ